MSRLRDMQTYNFEETNKIIKTDTVSTPHFIRKAKSLACKRRIPQKVRRIEKRDN